MINITLEDMIAILADKNIAYLRCSYGVDGTSLIIPVEKRRRFFKDACAYNALVMEYEGLSEEELPCRVYLTKCKKLKKLLMMDSFSKRCDIDGYNVLDRITEDKIFVRHRYNKEDLSTNWIVKAMLQEAIDDIGVKSFTFGVDRRFGDAAEYSSIQLADGTRRCSIQHRLLDYIRYDVVGGYYAICDIDTKEFDDRLSNILQQFNLDFITFIYDRSYDFDYTIMYIRAARIIREEGRTITVACNSTELKSIWESIDISNIWYPPYM